MNETLLNYWWPIDVLIHALLLLPLTGAVLRWTYLWQLKEYRWDRMRDFSRSRTGKRFILTPWVLLELAATVYLMTAPNWGGPDNLLAIVAAWLIFIFFECVRVLRRPLRPQWTAKAAALTLASLGTMVGAYALLWAIPEVTNPVVHLGIATALLVLTPIIVTLWVELLRPITNSQKRARIEQAKEKIQRLHPIVIGITGSFGKTSTKEYLSTILNTKWNVLATPKNINVDVGVAGTILSTLTDKHEIFIVEMGAYRPGEIASICNLVSPIIGILTAVSPQHLALFGSLEAIKRTKGELLAALPSSGLAVINKDSSPCLDLAEYSQAPVRYVSAEDVAHVYATEVALNPHKIQFNLHIGQERSPAVLHLHGVQVLPSVLAAVAVASHLGMSMADIITALERLSAPPGTMQLKNGRHHYSVIDDSYNANPDGFLAALDYLALFTDKRRIVITAGMLELGTESDQHHRLVGSRVGEVADLLIITKRDSSQPLAESALSSGLPESQIVIDDRLDRLIREHLEGITTDDVVLIEGRVQTGIREYLLRDSE